MRPRHLVTVLVITMALAAGLPQLVWAKTASVTVEASADIAKDAVPCAAAAAAAALKAAGHQVLESGAAADLQVNVTVEKMYSHHSIPPTVILLGGLADLTNYDSGHATVTTVVTEGGREVAKKQAAATKRDFPLFSWAQPARKAREKALRSAVAGSLSEYLAAHPAPK